MDVEGGNFPDGPAGVAGSAFPLRYEGDADLEGDEVDFMSKDTPRGGEPKPNEACASAAAAELFLRRKDGNSVPGDVLGGVGEGGNSETDGAGVPGAVTNPCESTGDSGSSGSFGSSLSIRGINPDWRG